MTESKTPQPISSLSMEALALAGITLTGYLSAYAFESGYAFIVGYPHDLVPPTLFSLLGLWTYILAFNTIGFLQISLQTIPSTPFNNIAHILLVFTSTSISIWLYAVAPPMLAGLGVTSGSLLIIAYMVLLHYLIRDNSHSGNVGFVTNFYDSRSNVPTTTPAYIIIKKFGFDPLLYAFIALSLLPVFSFSAGMAISKSRGNYFQLNCVNETSTPSVIVRRVSEYLVIMKVEPPISGEELKRRFTLRRLNDIQNCEFTKIGG